MLKSRFFVWSILRYRLCFKQAKCHLSPKLQLRYLLLAKLGIYFPCCNDCKVEKVYEQGLVPFFPHIVGQYDSSKRPIRLTPPILLLYELMRCGCVTSLAPLFILPLTFAHRFIVFSAICDVYDRVVVPFRNVYLSITAIIVCASFLLPKLFCFEQVVCSPLLFCRMAPVARTLFSANSIIRWSLVRKLSK